MGRLGSHPHLVTVFDLGEHEGQPWMVAELMAGGDVEGLIEKALRLERITRPSNREGVVIRPRIGILG